MVQFQASSRRFWVLGNTRSLMTYIGLVILAFVFLIFVYYLQTNLFSIIVLLIALLVAFFWIAQKPKTINVQYDGTTLHIDAKKFKRIELESWSLIDLPEKALVLIKLASKNHVIELYGEKDDLTASGLINELVETLPFNSELVSPNPLISLLRVIGLY